MCMSTGCANGLKCDDFIIMTVRGLGYKAVKTEA